MNYKKSKYIYLLFAVKYFTEIYTINKSVIPNMNVLIQACSNINYMFVDKINNSQNPKKIIKEKEDFKNNVKDIKKKTLDKKKKEEIKKKKEIADYKLKMKINAVEKIDSLLLNKKL